MSQFYCLISFCSKLKGDSFDVYLFRNTSLVLSGSIWGYLMSSPYETSEGLIISNLLYQIF